MSSQNISEPSLLTVAILGAGPAGLYTLHHLVESGLRAEVTVFESGSEAGSGTPYDPALNDPLMLANIASIEIPPLGITLCDWLRAQPAERLDALGIGDWPIDERMFYPRIVLGAYFRDRFAALVAAGAADGTTVTVERETLVADVVAQPRSALVKLKARGGAVTTRQFDTVVVATGHFAKSPADHDWQHGDDSANCYAELRDRAPEQAGERVAVLGTSLSAIDMTIALAAQFGDFVERGPAGDGVLEFVERPGVDAGHITMLSRRGLLPEADFYCRIPYTPLSICTAEAIRAATGGATKGRLDRVFAVFADQLRAEDPDYAALIGLDRLTADSFADAYFAERTASEPFDWAQRDHDEARANAASRTTVGWKYAILRMHEAIGDQAHRLGSADRKRFANGLARVFVDNYAAVPLLSIARLIALNRAGRLEVVRLGDDYTQDTAADGTATFTVGGRTLAFDTLIDARGQSALDAAQLAFPTLRLQSLANATGDLPPTAPIPLGVTSRLALRDGLNQLSRVYCLSIPHLLRRHPFIQGLTSCAQLSAVVVEAIVRDQAEAAATEPVVDPADDTSLNELIAELDNTALVHCMTSNAVVQVPAAPALARQDAA